MSTEANKELIRRYIQAIDDNDSSDWSVIDEYVAEDVIVHNPRYRAARRTVTESDRPPKCSARRRPAGTRSGCRSPSPMSRAYSSKSARS
jgi:hypothetical protein